MRASRKSLLSVSYALLIFAFMSAADSQKSDPGAGEALLLSNIRQLIFDGERSGEGYFSRDGSLLVFMSEREPGNPFFQIYLMNMKNGDVRRLSPGIGKATCAWIHPSNEKALFSSTHLDPQAAQKAKEEYELRAAGKNRNYGWNYDETYDIFELDLKSNQLRRLTETRGYDAEASYSPDGKTIVFASNRSGYEEPLTEKEKKLFEQDPSYMMEIYRMNADGSNVRRLTNQRGYDGGPFFSWDGSKICWRRFSEDGVRAELYTMEASGAGEKQITRLGAMSWAPFFHPSGDYLIFTTNLHGFSNFELYLVDAEGKSDPVRVTYTDGFDGLPAFSPDGKTLVWTSTRTPEKKAQLFTAAWNDAEARSLLHLPPARVSETAPDAVPASPLFSKTVSDISPADLRLYVSTLASEEMGGRLTGTKGAELATSYVADAFRSFGLEPAGENGGYFQDFDFTAGVSAGPSNRLEIIKDEPGAGSAPEQKSPTNQINVDWRPLGFSRPGNFGPASVVFAGYGISAPKGDGAEAYDSFAGLDLKDKWALVFRFLPEDISTDMRQHLSRFSNLRYKAMAAREKGALGLIVVSGPKSKVKEQLVPMSFDASLAGSGIAAISISDQTAEGIVASNGRSLEALQGQLDTGQPVTGFELKGVRLRATIDILQEKRRGRNVLARLDADAPTSVILGAHVDHLGDGSGGNSLARDDEKGKIHYGADDNASGVAAMLEIAQYLAAEKASGQFRPKRNIIFAAWTGEELGLLGSTHFARTFGGGAERAALTPDIAAYLNLDMVGRLDKSLIVQGVGSSSVWPTELERRNAVIGLPLVTQNESYLPTDATSFYLKKVPILSAFTGAHPDYHTPRDTADKINYDGEEKISRLFAMIVESISQSDQPPDYREMERPKNMQMGGRRVYLGTVPDFAQGNDVVGVKLAGVTKGAPAELAGLQAGDIVVELAGKAITNLYDYQFAMQGLKVGAPVQITVQRGGQRISMTITPGSRD